jgi:hypothetical protein
MIIWLAIVAHAGPWTDQPVVYDGTIARYYRVCGLPVPPDPNRELPEGSDATELERQWRRDLETLSTILTTRMFEPSDISVFERVHRQIDTMVLRGTCAPTFAEAFASDPGEPLAQVQLVPSLPTLEDINLTARELPRGRWRTPGLAVSLTVAAVGAAGVGVSAWRVDVLTNGALKARAARHHGSYTAWKRQRDGWQDGFVVSLAVTWTAALSALVVGLVPDRRRRFRR